MKILLIDHHELFRTGLRCMLQKLPGGVREVLEACNWKDGLQCIEQHPDLDMVLLELRSPRCKGVGAVKFLRQRYPKIPLVVVSGDEEFNVINKALSNGANGYIGKSSPEAMFLGALQLVLSGDTYVPPQMFRHLANPKEYRLTRRQSQMLGCLIEGLSNKEISECLDLAEGTVKVHIAAVYQVLRVRNRREAVAVAGQIGFGNVFASHGYPSAMACECREYGRMV